MRHVTACISICTGVVLVVPLCLGLIVPILACGFTEGVIQLIAPNHVKSEFGVTVERCCSPVLRLFQKV